MAALTLALLGGFRASLASGAPVAIPSKKAQALLAYLAAPPGQAHSREKLATLLWGDSGEEQARHSLRQTLFALRRALPESNRPILLQEGERVAIDTRSVRVDTVEFERLIERGRPNDLEQAITLYRGDFFEGVGVKEAAFEEWLIARRERLRELALEAMAKLLAHQTKADRVDEAIRLAARLLTLDPLQERVHRQLMRLYSRQGRRPAALRQYQLCCQVLERELGIEPEQETKELYQQIMRKPALKDPPTAPPAAASTRKGRSQKVRASAPLEVATPETALIGREEEIGRLRRVLDQAWRGRGQIAVVWGEAGIGKSRVVEEMMREAERRNGLTLLGRSHEAERILPYRPWVEAFRSVLLIPGASLMDELDPAWRAELARLFPELGELEPRWATGAEDYLRLFEAIARLLIHLAGRRPLLVALEDLHWADEMSVRLLSFLARRLSTLPVLILGTAWEAELEGAGFFRGLLQDLSRERLLTSLSLPPLSKTDTLALVRARAKAGTEEAVVSRFGDAIWTASEGNPFMVVETMRALQEGGAPTQAADRGGVHLPLPERVREVISRRLDRLNERGQQLMALAATVGGEFEFRLLQRSSGLDEVEAAQAVEELVRRRLLHGVGERFDSTHGTIREVAYGRLLTPRRKLLHGQVAKALEEIYADQLPPHYEALASHYRRADRPDKAIRYHLLAGEEAAKRYADQDATARYQEALTLARTLPASPEASTWQIDATLRLASVALTREDFERDLTNLQIAETLAEALGDPRRLSQVLYWIGRTHYVLGNVGSAIEHAERALTLADQVRDDSIAAMPVNLLGRSYFVRSDFLKAWPVLERSASQFGRLGNRIEAATAYGALGWSLAMIGEFKRAGEAADHGVRIAQESRHLPTEAACYQYRAGTRFPRGEWSQAIADIRRALELAQSVGDRFREYMTTGLLGGFLVMTGDHDTGVETLERARRAGEQLGTRLFLSVFQAYRAEASLANSEADQATRHAREAIATAKDTDDQWSEAWARRLLGEALCLRGGVDLREAEEEILEAIRIQQEIGAQPELARSYVSHARLLGAKGERDQVWDTLTRATAMFRQMGMAWDLECAQEVLERFSREDSHG